MTITLGIALVLATLLVAALGAACRNTAPALARCVAWLVAVGFVIGAAALPRTDEMPRAARVAEVELDSDAAARRTALLAAAATTDARADDLRVQWRAELADAAQGAGAPAALGVAATLPTPLPFQPETLQVTAAAPLQQGRPAELTVQCPALAPPCAAELIVRADGVEVARQSLTLGAAMPATLTFVPPQAGELELELSVRHGGHTVAARGVATVAAPPRVLVLEPSGIAAAALRAQGVAVEASAAPPSQWRDYAAIVVGQPLSPASQQELVAAVIDGVGVFALAPGFGGAEEPLRAVLPVRPAPVQPTRAPGEGADGTTPSAEPEAPPPDPKPPEPPPPEPPPKRPPQGETDPGRVGSQPIEVDKHSIAMVLVVDRSGSMGTTLANGQTKMGYARTSALRTAQALGAGDEVGVVTYGNKGQGRIELPLTDAAQTGVVAAGIDKLAHASERTFLLSGLQVAQTMLNASRAAVKHVVVITDGEFDIEEGFAMRHLARRLRTDQKASLSVIAITDRYTDSAFHRAAEELTRSGGGQFLPTSDASSVPTFVVAEVTRALQRVGRRPRDAEPIADASPTREPVAEPPPPSPPPPTPPPPAPAPPVEQPTARVPVRAIAPSPLLLPALQTEEWPSLGGALAGTAPLEAQVLLVASDAGWPLLAFANRGLGRVGAFAADLCGTDGAEFRAEAGFAGRFAAWLQSVLPPEPTAAPMPMLRSVEVSPPAPTPRDVAALTALAGAPPSVDAPSPGAAAVWQTRSVSTAGAAGMWLVLGLLLLVLVERWTYARQLRGGGDAAAGSEA